EGYTFVFLDCPPSLGPLTVNALAAADRVLVPVQAEYYALEGLSQLLRSVDIIKARLNPRLGIAGVLLTMVDARTRLSADVDAEAPRLRGCLRARRLGARAGRDPAGGRSPARRGRLGADRRRASLAGGPRGRARDAARARARGRRPRFAASRPRRERRPRGSL